MGVVPEFFGQLCLEEISQLLYCLVRDYPVIVYFWQIRKLAFAYAAENEEFAVLREEDVIGGFPRRGNIPDSGEGPCDFEVLCKPFVLVILKLQGGGAERIWHEGKVALEIRKQALLRNPNEDALEIFLCPQQLHFRALPDVPGA